MRRELLVGPAFAFIAISVAACPPAPINTPLPDASATAAPVDSATSSAPTATAVAPSAQPSATAKAPVPASSTSTFPTAAEASCASHDECGWAETAARCVTKRTDDRSFSNGPIRVQGDYCECVEGQCRHGRVDPITCTTSAECDVTRHGGRLAPTRASGPKTPFKPCQDGEYEGRCKEGQCTVIIWKC